MYIELSDLLLLILFLLGATVGIYILILVKNLNSSVLVLKELLKNNKENIHDTLKELPTISKNLTEITETAKNELKSVENALTGISETVELTAATVHTIKNDVVGKVSGVVGIIDVIRRVFFKEKEDNKADKEK